VEGDVHRISEVVGLPIVSGENGERIGKVADVLMDPDSKQLVGLVVAGGLLASEQVLPFSDVQTLGKDAVVARTASGLVNPKEWAGRAIATRRTSTLMKKPVITDAGRELGEVRDVVVDESNGAVDGLDIAGRRFAAVVPRRAATPGNEMVVGPDALIVPERSLDASGTSGKSKS
jgi:uncharacterized protein YrrD